MRKYALIGGIAMITVILSLGLYFITSNYIALRSTNLAQNNQSLDTSVDSTDSIDSQSEDDAFKYLNQEIPPGMKTVSGDHVSGMLRNEDGEIVIFQIFNGKTEFSIDGGVTWTEEKPPGTPDIPR